MTTECYVATATESPRNVEASASLQRRTDDGRVVLTVTLARGCDVATLLPEGV